jgi:hypothetical protein
MAEKPQKGRPRLTEDDLKARIKAYCKAYGVGTNDQGLPEFPAGRRETPQHREWIAVYKLWSRLGRRKRGQCERCAEPVAENSIFCEAHKAERSGAHAAGKLSLDQRRDVHDSQKGLCPVCAQKVDLLESTAHRAGDSGTRALLHASCGRLATQAEKLGREGVERLTAYLWSRTRKARG